MKILKLMSLVCAMAYLAAGQEKEEQQPKVVLEGHGVGTNTVSWTALVKPVPCVSAEVLLTTTSGQDPSKSFGNLSVDQLHERYKSFQTKINNAWAESKRRKTDINVAQMENWKKELALTFVILQDRDSANEEEIDQTFSTALTSPSTANNVTSNCSYTRSLAANLNIVMAKQESEKSRLRLVAEKSGLILGFLEAEPAQQIQEIRVPGTAVTTRTFRVMQGSMSTSDKTVYAINFEVPPATGRPAGTKYQLTSPALQIIIEPGVTPSPHWDIAFQADKDFGQVTLPLRAELWKFSDKQAWEQRKNPIKHEISVPISQPTFKPQSVQRTTEVPLWAAISVPIVAALIGAAAPLIALIKRRTDAGPEPSKVVLAGD